LLMSPNVTHPALHTCRNTITSMTLTSLLLLLAVAAVVVSASSVKLHGETAAIEFVSGGVSLRNGPAAGEASLNGELRVGDSGIAVGEMLLAMNATLTEVNERLTDANARIATLEAAAAGGCAAATADGVMSVPGGPDVYCDVTHKGSGKP
jgi:hypothetical protein